MFVTQISLCWEAEAMGVSSYDFPDPKISVPLIMFSCVSLLPELVKLEEAEPPLVEEFDVVFGMLSKFAFGFSSFVKYLIPHIESFPGNFSAFYFPHWNQMRSQSKR